MRDCKMRDCKAFAMVAPAALALALAAMPGAVPEAQAQDRPLTFGLPGIPPVFANVMPYVARDAGFYDKYGVNVSLRPFDSGAAAARAVQARDIEVSLSPTPVIVNMKSNADDVEIVAVWGMERPTWILGSVDPDKIECEDVRGEAVGVDSIGGARYVAMRSLISPCGLTTDDVQPISLSANVGAAMIAGQIPFGVLHMDDIPVIEGQTGEPLNIVSRMAEVNPVNHYLVLISHRDTLEANRDAFVRLVAAHIDAIRWMQDPDNYDEIARIAEPTGRAADVAEQAVAAYIDMGFWPQEIGLTPENIQAVIDVQVRVGGIREGRTPVAYEQLVDLSIYEEALQLVEEMSGR